MGSLGNGLLVRLHLFVTPLTKPDSGSWWQCGGSVCCLVHLGITEPRYWWSDGAAFGRFAGSNPDIATALHSLE